MADTTEHGPGGHPDAVNINPDGTPDTGGRIGWIWMEDPTTGGRSDVHSSRAAWHVARGMRVVQGYPMHVGRSARSPKAAVGKGGGTPAERQQTTAGPPRPARDAVEPAPERQPDDAPAAPDDQAADGGKPTTRKAGAK